MSDLVNQTNEKWDYVLFQSNLYEKVVMEFARQLCQRITSEVIHILQNNEAGVLGEDTGLKNQWEEICVIVDEGDGDLYDAAIDTIHGITEMVLEEADFAPCQLAALWLQTEPGIDWKYDDQDKSTSEISLIWNEQDISTFIRDDYILPAALDYSCESIEQYQSGRYGDDNYEEEEDELLYPKPDRSNKTPNFVKTPENEALDIGWNEGFLSDGRPYRAECWAESQITALTFFFSTAGMENFSNAMFQGLLMNEGLLEVISDIPCVYAMPFKDASGNSMWAVTATIGDEDELMASSSVSLQKYEKSPA